MSMLFKVTGESGQSCHGDACTWPLPTESSPGDWLNVEGFPSLHLVPETGLLSHYKTASRLWVAEGDIRSGVNAEPRKAAFNRARLVHEVTPDWPLLEMFPLVRVYLAKQAFIRAIEAGDMTARIELDRIDLSGADLSGIALCYANLSGAILTRANLNMSNLQRANLLGADLSRADLSRADIRGADLALSDLTGAVLDNANMDETITVGAFMPAVA